MSTLVADIPHLVTRVIPADPSNYYHDETRTNYDLIVNHITDGHESVEGTAKMFQKAHHGASCNFAVGSAPLEIIQCVPMRFGAWHCMGRKPTDPLPDAIDKFKQNALINRRSIGIEHGARTPGELGRNDKGIPLTEPQLRLSAKLVAYLCKAGGFVPSRTRIVGHVEADPTTSHTD